MASVMNMVTLVNALGEPIGQMEKLEAHQKGLLHLAFSVLIFNDQQEILIQQRASTKYHSPDLWANACCSHPEPDDTRSMECIARDRLQFEMGIDCVLKLSSQMTYISHFDNGLTEHEYDHILVGYCNETPKPNPDEVSATRWLSLQRLKHELHTHPEHFASWFIKLFQQQHIHVIQ